VTRIVGFPFVMVALCSDSKKLSGEEQYMLEETVGKIEEKIRQAGSIPDQSKTELLALFATLKSEIDQLSETHGEEARNITGFTEVSAHEATREEKNPELLRLSIDRLRTSVDGFEQSHPKLVEIVNRICVTLSNLGV
jgi:hypothetical protein